MLSSIGFLLLPKLKTVDHYSGQRSQDFKVSVSSPMAESHSNWFIGVLALQLRLGKILLTFFVVLTLYSQRCCAHHTPKNGLITTLVPLWLPVRGLHILKIALRIIQHISKSIQNKKKSTKVLPRRNCKAKTPLNQLECDSAIGLLTLT